MSRLMKGIDAISPCYSSEFPISILTWESSPISCLSSDVFFLDFSFSSRRATSCHVSWPEFAFSVSKSMISCVHTHLLKNRLFSHPNEGQFSACTIRSNIGMVDSTSSALCRKIHLVSCMFLCIFFYRSNRSHNSDDRDVVE